MADEAPNVPWSSSAILRRLGYLVETVPKWASGSQSTTIGGMASYARDAAILQRITRDVLRGVNARRPDPEFGDDGVREDARQTANEAMAWGERWLAWRIKDNWNIARCDFGDPLPEPG